MTTESQFDARWEGPFSWPAFEHKSELPSLPRAYGLYLQTFEYQDGYLIYCAGLTRRPVATRLKEHTREYRKGGYNVLDTDAVRDGIRKEIWHGWGYARNHPDEFKQRQKEIVEAVEKQLSAFRIFVANVGDEPRVLERLEAAVMNNLYQQPSPICDVPDKGMFLSPRTDSEDRITIRNECSVLLYGLPDHLAI